MNMHALLNTIALTGSCALASLCAAETSGTVHLGQDAVSKNQVIELLSPHNKTGQLRTRGIRLHTQPSDTPAVQAEPRSLSLEVYFDFDSASLSEEARQQLYPVGQALQSNELANLEFTLEGHTDAMGDDTYNLSLSELRARAVMEFFVEEFQLSPERVAAYGRGESQLLDNENPNSGANRRVSIIAQ